MLSLKAIQKIEFRKRIISKQKKFYRTVTQIANRKLEMWHVRKTAKYLDIAVILQVSTSRAMNEM